MKKIKYLTEDDIKIICEELTSFFIKVKDPAPIYKQSCFEKLTKNCSISKQTGRRIHNSS